MINTIILSSLLAVSQAGTTSQICDEICIIKSSQVEIVGLLNSDPKPKWPKALPDLAEGYITCAINIFDEQDLGHFDDFEHTDALFLSVYNRCEQERLAFNADAKFKLLQDGVFDDAQTAREKIRSLRGIMLLSMMKDEFDHSKNQTKANEYAKSRFPYLYEEAQKESKE